MKNINKNEKNLLLKPEFIKDFFYSKESKIVVLENKAFKNMPDDTLILAKEIVDGLQSTIVPLTDEEYTKAAKAYEKLLKTINSEREDD